ncbi:hypothetical protein lerEdw1_014410 [Lerista edwardsae]|nr:hypothetical protein lerEdw1_014410 [Lerista edwardsae]
MPGPQWRLAAAQGTVRGARWAMPWAVVRLVNLSVVLALSLQHTQQLQGCRPARPQEAVNSVRAWVHVMGLWGLMALYEWVFLAAAGGRWRGLLIQLNQSRAFDRVDRDYLWAVLREHGVPEAFVHLLQGLYERATAAPVVQGWRGAPVLLASELRQGCPLSPLLYVLALEPLLGAIRADGRIAGILVCGSGQQLKAVAHADDAYVLLRHGEGELCALRELLAQYGTVSGAAVNTRKSCCYAPGPSALDIVWRPLEGEGEEQGIVAGKGTCAAAPPSAPPGPPATTTVCAVKVLGIRFGLGRDAWELDWRACAEAAEERLHRWAHWRLGVYQRVRLFEAYCFPAALGLATVYPPPRAVVALITAAFFHFVWDCRRFSLMRVVAYRSVADGGLGAQALGPLFVATFLAANFGAWERWHAAAEGGAAGPARHWHDYCQGLAKDELCNVEHLPLCQLEEEDEGSPTTGLQFARVLEKVASALRFRRRLVQGRGLRQSAEIVAVDPMAEGELSGDQAESDDGADGERMVLARCQDVAEDVAACGRTERADSRQQGASLREMPPACGEHMQRELGGAGRKGEGESDECMQVEETPSAERPQTSVVKSSVKTGVQKEQVKQQSSRSGEDQGVADARDLEQKEQGVSAQMRDKEGIKERVGVSLSAVGPVFLSSSGIFTPLMDEREKLDTRERESHAVGRKALAKTTRGGRLQRSSSDTRDSERIDWHLDGSRGWHRHVASWGLTGRPWDNKMDVDLRSDAQCFRRGEEEVGRMQGMCGVEGERSAGENVCGNERVDVAKLQEGESTSLVEEVQRHQRVEADAGGMLVDVAKDSEKSKGSRGENGRPSVRRQRDEAGEKMLSNAPQEPTCVGNVPQAEDARQGFKKPRREATEDSSIMSEEGGHGQVEQVIPMTAIRGEEEGVEGRYRARGPLVEQEGWQRHLAGQERESRVSGTGSCLVGGLRKCEGDPLVSSVQGVLLVIQEYFEVLFAHVGDGSRDRVEIFLAKSRRHGPEPGVSEDLGEIEVGPNLTKVQREAMVRAVTVTEVREAIGVGHTTVAPGPDGLPYGFYQAFQGLLTEPLTHVFNVLLKGSGAVDSRFVGGHLRLFPKEGDPTLLKNWRPITISM